MNYNYTYAFTYNMHTIILVSTIFIFIIQYLTHFKCIVGTIDFLKSIVRLYIIFATWYIYMTLHYDYYPLKYLYINPVKTNNIIIYHFINYILLYLLFSYQNYNIIYNIGTFSIILIDNVFICLFH